jgi:ribosomal protein L7/L12
MSISQLDAATRAKIVELMRRGDKVNAIIVYRSVVQAGLKEAKDAVEAIAETDRITRPRPSPASGTR